jgi:hypothetical protein
MKLKTILFVSDIYSYTLLNSTIASPLSKMGKPGASTSKYILSFTRSHLDNKITFSKVNCQNSNCSSTIDFFL